MNPLPGPDDLPPGTRAQDLSDRDRRREDAEDREFWNEWWGEWCVRREREESQRGNEGEPHE